MPSYVVSYIYLLSDLVCGSLCKGVSLEYWTFKLLIIKSKPGTRLYSLQITPLFCDLQDILLNFSQFVTEVIVCRIGAQANSKTAGKLGAMSDFLCPDLVSEPRELLKKTESLSHQP